MDHPDGPTPVGPVVPDRPALDLSRLPLPRAEDRLDRAADIAPGSGRHRRTGSKARRPAAGGLAGVAAAALLVGTGGWTAAAGLAGASGSATPQAGAPATAGVLLGLEPDDVRGRWFDVAVAIASGGSVPSLDGPPGATPASVPPLTSVRPAVRPTPVRRPARPAPLPGRQAVSAAPREVVRANATVLRLVRSYFPADQVGNAMAVVTCESDQQWWQRGEVNRDGTRDWGLFQLNDGGTLQGALTRLGIHPSSVRQAQLLALNPTINARAAQLIYRDRGWSPWVCAYLKGIVASLWSNTPGPMAGRYDVGGQPLALTPPAHLPAPTGAPHRPAPARRPTPKPTPKPAPRPTPTPAPRPTHTPTPSPRPTQPPGPTTTPSPSGPVPTPTTSSPAPTTTSPVGPVPSS